MTATESPPAVPTGTPTSVPPLVALTAAVGLSVALSLTLDPEIATRAAQLIALFVFSAVGVWISIVDAREHRIPNRLLLPLAAALAGFVLVGTIATGHPEQLLLAVAGAGGLFTVYLLLAIAGGIGFGDVKLGAVVGLYLTWPSPTAAITATVLAYVLAVPHAVIALTGRRRTTLARRVPFGPYMVGGAIAAAILALL